MPWLLFPFYIIYRMWRSPAPFTYVEHRIATQPLMEQSGLANGLEGV